MRKSYYRFIGIILLTASLLLVPNNLLLAAAEPHTDPGSAVMIFSPVSLLQYYSETQDYLLRKDAKTVAARLEKIPFANIPEKYIESIASLNRSEIELVNILAGTDAKTSELDEFLGQSRLDEMVAGAKDWLLEIDKGSVLVAKIRQDIGRIGTLAGVAYAAELSLLAVTYRQLMAKVDMKGEVLRQMRPIVEKYSTTRAFRRTAITLQVDPPAAFVGDTVQFHGFLAAGEERLSNRQVNILLNGRQYASAVTDAAGVFRSSLQVPYEYVPFLNLEAIYIPQGGDLGIYLAAKSPQVRLNVLFYSAILSLSLPDKTYPGRDILLDGWFSYDDAPVPDVRTLEIYFDDDLLGRSQVGQVFSLNVMLPRYVEIGKHTITVRAIASGRYAPARASGDINIVRVTPVVRLDMPAAAFFPGIVRISGQVFSDLGPAADAGINIRIGEAASQGVTSPDGSFDVQFRRGLGLELLSLQPVKLVIRPAEAWHTTASTAGNIIVVNWLNSAGIIGLIAAAGIVMRRRLAGFTFTRQQLDRRGATSPLSAVSQVTTADESGKAREHSPHRLVILYRRIIALIQTVLGIVFSPQQTMREYLAVVLPGLGPVGGVFKELTYKVERLLYSRWEPTADESSRLDDVARKVEGHLGKPI